MDTAGEFPTGETLAAGEYELTEHLCGHGDWELHVGARASRPDDRHLISVVRAGDLRADELWQRLSYEIPGIFPLLHLGHFDRRGDDPVRNTMQGAYAGMVEKLPEGSWMPRWSTAPFGPARAIELGLAVGKVLEAAARAGVLLIAIRPHTIWARRDDERVVFTGLSGRIGPFFAARAKSSMVSRPAFERHYAAPEVWLGVGESERSLVFSLAIMIAEWATGNYPFPDSRIGGSNLSLTMGRHAALEVPIRLAGILTHGLERRPEDRPPLESFLARLGDLVEPARPPAPKRRWWARWK
jgi:hypothetical protein